MLERAQPPQPLERVARCLGAAPVRFIRLNRGEARRGQHIEGGGVGAAVVDDPRGVELRRVALPHVRVERLVELTPPQRVVLRDDL